LEHLDISYTKLATDEGFKAFEGKRLPIEYLGLVSLSEDVTSAGLAHLITACKESLAICDCALMRQEELAKPEWSKALGNCFNLEYLDVSGNKGLTDDFFM
jgi:hypothetical protein